MKYFIPLLSVFVFLTIGCTERVPPGYVGMIMTPEGLSQNVLQAGNHSCWGRDRMILVETKEQTRTEQIAVLCADDLNFNFELNIRSRLQATNPKAILELLNRQGANIKWEGSSGVLRVDGLYSTYVRSVAVSIARDAVSKYETTQIRAQRESLSKTISAKLTTALSGTPMEMTLVNTSNFDYPDVITKAVEKKRTREIQIDEERAKQAMVLLQADNRLKLAQKMKVVRTAEAEAESIFNRILSGSLTDRYLRLREIEAKKVLYENVSAGDKVIVTGGGNVSHLVGR